MYLFGLPSYMYRVLGFYKYKSDFSIKNLQRNQDKISIYIYIYTEYNLFHLVLSYDNTYIALSYSAK